MDVHALHDCFAATLQQDQLVRQQAESQLRQVETTPGFLGGCLDIISTPEVNPGIKKAAVIFFKNRVTRQWNNSNLSKGGIDGDEKPVIKDRLLVAIVNSQMQIRNQLFPVLNTIVVSDYPKNWPEFLPNTARLLQSGDIASVYAGILCFSEITRSYRWTTNEDRPALDGIIKEFFPIILNIGNELLKESSFEAGEMVKLILKCYKFVTYHDLPLYLQSQSELVNWGTFHVNVIQKELPQEIMDLDESERKLHSWVKSQKWAYANLYRLFIRYGSSTLTRKYNYDNFKAMYVESFIPSLLDIYFQLIDKWCNKTIWLSNDSIYYLLEFITHCVTQKKTWGLIKPHVETLIEHFIFPLLCPSDETLELFENDPQEYIHMTFDIYEDTNAPDTAASSLLITLADKRRKSTLDTILHFAYAKLTALNQAGEETLEIAKQKEGALRVIGPISHNLTIEASPYYNQMEEFLATFVFPNFDSKYSFLRARTCEISCKFADLKFTDQKNLAVLYHGVLKSFDDVNLPTQLEAALALQTFIRLPEFQDALSLIILPTMQKLLELSDSIDNDAISGVMQECVEVFSVQLQPFGIDLMTKLVDQFMRLATELNDAAASTIDDVEDGDFEDTADKNMAAIGLLNTMITVLLSFENSVEICMTLESVFVPAIEFVLLNSLDDYFAEVAELIENSTFLIRSVTPLMWKIFELLAGSFKNGTALMYMDEMMPALNNYLVFGQDDLKKNPAYAQAFFSLFKSIIEGDDNQVGANEIALATQLAHTFILSLQELSVPYIPEFVNAIIQQIQNEDPVHVRNSTHDVNLINVAIAAFIYDSDTTLNILASHNVIDHFFKCWFNLIPSLRRVFDIKLSILGLLGLGNSSVSYINEEILSEVGKKSALLLGKLPEAVANLNKKRKNFDSTDFESSYDANDNEEWENEDFDETEENANADDYLEFLQQESLKLKSAGFYDEEDEDIIEDALSTTPLDSINVYSIFHNTFMAIQSNNPVKYQAIISQLTAEEQNSIAKSAELVGEE